MRANCLATACLPTLIQGVPERHLLQTKNDIRIYQMSEMHWSKNILLSILSRENRAMNPLCRAATGYCSLCHSAPAQILGWKYHRSQHMNHNEASSISFLKDSWAPSWGSDILMRWDVFQSFLLGFRRKMKGVNLLPMFHLFYILDRLHSTIPIQRNSSMIWQHISEHPSGSGTCILEPR